MPIDGDAGFIAQVRSLSRREPLAENVLCEVVVRLQSRMPRWDRVGICLLVDDTLVPGPSVGDLNEHSLTTRSELVVLIQDAGDVVAQLGVESDHVGAFGRQDELLLERLVPVISSACRAARDRLATRWSIAQHADGGGRGCQTSLPTSG